MKYADFKAVYLEKKLSLEAWKSGLPSDRIRAGSTPFKQYEYGTKSDNEKLAQVNPNYSSGEYQWRHNCQRCVVAWELIQRGYDVTAKPFNPNDSIGDSAIAAWKFEGENWWKDPDIRFKFSKFELKKELAEAFTQWGENARAVIRIKRLDGSAHTFTARKLKGKIVYEDPQSNQTLNIDEVLKDATLIKGKNWFMRIDNREFTAAVSDAVFELE